MPVTDFSLDRGLPASPEAERSILGATLLDNALQLEVSATLKAEHFFLDAHRRIYQRIADLSETNRPIDIVTLTEELRRYKELDAVGGAGYLSSLTDGVPRRSSVEHYVRIVLDKAMLRNLIHASNANISQALDQAATANEVIGEAEARIFELRADEIEDAPNLRTQCLDACNRMADERARPDHALLGLTTCNEELDFVTTGICPGELWVVGAPPARAKTAYALQIARANASVGVPVAMESLEMSDYPVLKRCAAAVSGIPASKFKDAKRMSPEEFLEAQEAMATIAGWPLHLDDRRISSVQQAIARARLYVRRQGAKLIIVDHLLALSNYAPGRDVRHQVTYACNALREFAKDEQVGVVVLHHLKRPANQNDRPTLFDLKESGDVEGFAHVVLLLYRPVDESNVFTGEDEIIVAKIRDGGESGTMNVWFDKKSLEYKPRYVGGK